MVGYHRRPTNLRQGYLGDVEFRNSCSPSPPFSSLPSCPLSPSPKMLQLRNVLFVFILSLVYLSSAVRLRYRREALIQGNDLSLRTNAARMAAGLGPLPPRRADPTRVAAKRAQPSGNPCTSYTSDYIKVYRSSNGVFLGYIKKTPTEGGYGLTSGQGSAIKISFSACDSSSPISISIDGAPAPNSYLGFTGTNINTGTSSSAILAPVKNTPANSPPSNNMESAVWQFASNHIAAQWVNVDSSKPPTYLFYNPNGSGYIQITADPGKFTQQYPNSYAVYFVVSNTA